MACSEPAPDTATLLTLDADSVTAGIQPHRAAQHCANLTAHGHDDWYLPAQEELHLLYTNRNAGSLAGSFDLTGTMPAGYYFSSSEDSSSSIRHLRFSNGDQFLDTKDKQMSVRCVRK